MAVRKVAITLPEELYDLVERAREVAHRTRSEVIQEAIRTHFGEAVFVPSEAERRALLEALDEVDSGAGGLRSCTDVRTELRAGQ